MVEGFSFFPLHALMSHDNQRAFGFAKALGFSCMYNIKKNSLTIYDPRVHKLHIRNINKIM